MTMFFGFKSFLDMTRNCMDRLLKYLQETMGIDIKTNSEVGFLIECDLEIDENFIGK